MWLDILVFYAAIYGVLSMVFFFRLLVAVYRTKKIPRGLARSLFTIFVLLLGPIFFWRDTNATER